ARSQGTRRRSFRGQRISHLKENRHLSRRSKTRVGEPALQDLRGSPWRRSCGDQNVGIAELGEQIFTASVQTASSPSPWSWSSLVAAARQSGETIGRHSVPRCRAR